MRKQAKKEVVESIEKEKIGKRKNPDYRQMLCYVPIRLHDEVKMALLRTHAYDDVSELVEALLSEWVKAGPKKMKATEKA